MTYQTALVVDDSKLARITLRKKLEQRHIQVALAESAQEAFDYLESNKPDIIFMDHLMPDIDGLSLAAQLRTIYGDQLPPLLLLTVSSDRLPVNEIRKLGIRYWREKPILGEELLAIFSKCLGISTPASLEAVQEPAAVSAEAMTILVAEDNAINQLVIKTMLKSMV